MDSRERLARVIFCNVSGVREEYPPIVRAVIWEAAYQKIASGQTMLGDWPHEAADAILASDWLRDTLAKERERCAKVADGWPIPGTVLEKGIDGVTRMYSPLGTAIRNLEPEPTDDRG